MTAVIGRGTIGASIASVAERHEETDVIVWMLGGLVFLVVGVLMLVGAFLVPSGEAALTFGILGLTFVPIGIVWLLVVAAVRRRQARARRLLREGLDGTATIMSVEDTNITVNQAPLVRLHLNVEVPGRPTRAVAHQTVVPRPSVGRLVPGATLPVKVDPADPEEVLIQWGAVSPVWAGSVSIGVPSVTVQQMPLDPDAQRALQDFGQMLATHLGAAGLGAAAATGGRMDTPGSGVGDTGPTVVASSTPLPGNVGSVTSIQVGSPTTPVLPVDAAGRSAPAASSPAGPTDPVDLVDPDRARRLAITGMSGTARIDRVQDVGVDMGDRRLYAFDLTVTPDARAPYTTRTASLVPRSAVARVMLGATVPARIDRSDPHVLVLDWDKA